MVDNVKIQKNKFNLNAIAIQNLILDVSDIIYEKEQASLKINNFSFKESTGLNLEQLSFNAKISDSKLHINNIKFKLDKNRIVGDISLNYFSITRLINATEATKVNLNIPTISLYLNDFLEFEPALRNNKYVKEFIKKPITGNLYGDGDLSNIEISNSKLNWGKSTNFYLEGNIINLTNIDKFQINIPNFKVKTIRKDILKFINEKELGIQVPKEITLTGEIKGSLKDVKTNLKLKSTQGDVFFSGSFSNKKSILYDAKINIENYKVDELLKNSSMGEISLTINSKGKGNTLSNLDASIYGIVSKFKFNKYFIKDLNFNGGFKDGVGTIASNYKDSNLNVKFDGSVDLDSIKTSADFTINLIGADLEALGIMDRKVKTGMKISLGFKGNLKNYKVDANIANGVVIYDNRTYLLGALKLDGFVNKDSTSVKLNNKMLNLNLQSNTDPVTFTNSLQEHILSYFYQDIIISDTNKSPVKLKFKVAIAQTPLLEEVFLMNVKDIDTIDISVDFDEAKRILDAKLTAPHINYAGNEIDRLAFTMNTDKQNFDFEFGFLGITASPLKVPKTVITGNQNNNKFSLNFIGYHKEEKLINIKTNIKGNRERLSFTINPDSLILNKVKWIIPKDNEIILLNTDKLSFTNFKLTKNNQAIDFTNNLENIKKNHIAVEYSNFNISEFFNFFNLDEKIATGILNGNFVLENPFHDAGIITNLNINKLKILKTDLGKLTLDAKSLGGNKYGFSAKLKEGDIDLDINGDYFSENEESNLNFQIAINKFKMKALNTLSLKELKETSGAFSGDFKVTGSILNPIYNGELIFKDAVFNISKLNTKFTLTNEILKVDNDGLYMSKFTVLDANKNALILSGNIDTENFVNPKFDLQLKANNFILLNATKEDNKSLYGKATLTAIADLTGDLQTPKLKANVTVGSNTDITYVLPSSYVNIENRDDVVVFVNRENPETILTKTEEKISTLSGFDISTKLEINKKASVNIIINEDTGDNFKVSGDGNFIFNIMPNGRISLSGNYEIADGHYELNLYNLVNRRFNLAPGGSVSWYGDPFDANLDVSAIYNLETSATSLMASQISNEDSSIKNKFKQVLPFNVYLNIDGELLQPKISFKLDMPEDAQGAIGGQVYSRIQQVNQQEEELNKQVFSLLVLNRFYPDAFSDGSSGGFTTIARDNLNDAISGQLNSFSDKILGGSGIEINFDLNSYTDYQGNAPTDRTQLGVTAQKKLFKERLVVRVGSDVDLQGSSTTGEVTPLIGDVSLEYKISKDGRYRLRGFRKSEFENVIEGQTIISGISLIFTQEFNKFNELWDAIFKAQNEKKENENKKTKEKVKKKAIETDKSIEKEKN